MYIKSTCSVFNVSQQVGSTTGQFFATERFPEAHLRRRRGQILSVRHVSPVVQSVSVPSFPDLNPALDFPIMSSHRPSSNAMHPRRPSFTRKPRRYGRYKNSFGTGLLIIFCRARAFAGQNFQQQQVVFLASCGGGADGGGGGGGGVRRVWILV